MVVFIAEHGDAQPPTPAPGSSAARPPTANKAAAHFDRGVELYRQRAYQAARVEFQRAYELSPHYSVLYNLGQSAYQLRDFADALQSFEKYLREGGTAIGPDRRAAVEMVIKTLRSFVASVEVAVDQDGAAILIDDAPMGQSPLAAPLVINAGQRKVSATKQGFRPATAWVTVAGSESARVQLQLVPVQPEAPSEPATPPATPTPTPSTPPTPAEDLPKAEQSIPWLGWALTGAFAAGATVTGILALRSSSNLESDRTDAPASRADLDDGVAETRNWALTTDILAGAALVTGGISLYLTLDQPSDRSPPSTAKIRLAPAGVEVSGSF